MAASRENTVNVPVEPTEAMIEAAEAHWLRGGTGGWSRDNPRGIWSAMLSAAPIHEGVGELVAWRLRRVGREVWNLWDSDPRSDTSAYSDAAEWQVEPLYAAPPPAKDEQGQDQ
jgi:hypothetical protein